MDASIIALVPTPGESSSARMRSNVSSYHPPGPNRVSGSQRLSKNPILGMRLAETAKDTTSKPSMLRILSTSRSSRFSSIAFVKDCSGHCFGVIIMSTLHGITRIMPEKISQRRSRQVSHPWPCVMYMMRASEPLGTNIDSLSPIFSRLKFSTLTCRWHRSRSVSLLFCINDCMIFLTTQKEKSSQNITKFMTFHFGQISAGGSGQMTAHAPS
jgi:hypothetical protein